MDVDFGEKLSHTVFASVSDNSIDVQDYRSPDACTGRAPGRKASRKSPSRNVALGTNTDAWLGLE